MIDLVERAAYERREVAADDVDGSSRRVSWGIAVETPVQVSLNGEPWTVMLASPADLEDLAIGLAVTERVLLDHRAVERIVISEFLNDIALDITVGANAIDRNAQRARSLVSSTACGLCGIESLAQLQQRTAAVRGESRITVTDASLRRAFASLHMHQPVNEVTRSVHAAAWCTLDGDISLAREDVGRHNALDKLIGALARAHRLDEPGFIVMSSRCSYELVYKAATANTQLLATISAPTSMALSWARALNLPLACHAGRGSIVRFDEEQASG